MEGKAVYICGALLVALLVAIIRLVRQEKLPTIDVPTEGAPGAYRSIRKQH